MLRTGRLILSLVVAGPRIAQPLYAQHASVADSSPFSPARPADAERISHRLRASRTEVLAAAGRLSDRAHRSTPKRTSFAAIETIHYVNHSPDSLPYLWLFVEQNICEPNSVTNVLNQPPLVFLGSSFDFSCRASTARRGWSR